MLVFCSLRNATVDHLPITKMGLRRALPIPTANALITKSFSIPNCGLGRRPVWGAHRIMTIPKYPEILPCFSTVSKGF